MKKFNIDLKKNIFTSPGRTVQVVFLSKVISTNDKLTACFRNPHIASKCAYLALS